MPSIWTLRTTLTTVIVSSWKALKDRDNSNCTKKLVLGVTYLNACFIPNQSSNMSLPDLLDYDFMSSGTTRCPVGVNALLLSLSNLFLLINDKRGKHQRGERLWEQQVYFGSSQIRDAGNWGCTYFQGKIWYLHLHSVILYWEQFLYTKK